MTFEMGERSRPDMNKDLWLPKTGGRPRSDRSKNLPRQEQEEDLVLRGEQSKDRSHQKKIELSTDLQFT